jgi:hypothetical protein
VYPKNRVEGLSAQEMKWSTKIKEQRTFALALLVAAIVLISVGGISYVFVQQREEWTTVVFETSGVTLEIGVDWLYGEFRGMDHPNDILLAVGVSGEIAGGNGGSVRYNFNHDRMTLTEYLQLNETEHTAIFASGESSQYGVPGTSFGGGGWAGPINDETYVWALRFLEVGGQTEGSITISFRVIIRAM